jgi:hypothetical protein
MHYDALSSSIISSIGYDDEQQLLEVHFSDGDIHQYLDVPVEKFKALMATDAHESYFAHNIRGMYEYRQVATGLPKAYSTSTRVDHK